MTDIDIPTLLDLLTAYSDFIVEIGREAFLQDTVDIDTWEKRIEELEAALGIEWVNDKATMKGHNA